MKRKYFVSFLSYFSFTNTVSVNCYHAIDQNQSFLIYYVIKNLKKSLIYKYKNYRNSEEKITLSY